MSKDVRSSQTDHRESNPEFWDDEAVRNYDYRQSIVSEEKEEALQCIVHAASYCFARRGVSRPVVLDVGCGPDTLSARILNAVPESAVHGADVSGPMLEAAGRTLGKKYGSRFHCRTGDFNTKAVWPPEAEREYDAVVSAGALHYLSDARRGAFLQECFLHTESRRVSHRQNRHLLGRRRYRGDAEAVPRGACLSAPFRGPWGWTVCGIPAEVRRDG